MKVTGEEKRHRHSSQSRHRTIAKFCFNVGPVSNIVNIETALGECHVFADVLAQSIQQTQCWISVGPALWTIDWH